MEIEESFISRSSGKEVKVFHKDSDSLETLNERPVAGVHGFCFCDGKLVIVYSESKGYWSVPGGGVEEGETVEEALIRETKEETNMNVVRHKLLGFIDLHYFDGKTERQARYVAEIKPEGDFTEDPDGDITEIKLIDPNDLKQYVDWQKIGDHLLERAVNEIKELSN